MLTVPQSSLPALKPAMADAVQIPASPHAPGPAQTPATEKSATVPAAPNPKKTPASETGATKIDATDSAPTVKKTYEPMPFVESAFHKTPPKRARKPRANAKKAAAEPEPKPQPKKFMTAAGAAYLKSLDGGDDTTDYDNCVAPLSSLKRPSQEVRVLGTLQKVYPLTFPTDRIQYCQEASTQLQKYPQSRPSS